MFSTMQKKKKKRRHFHPAFMYYEMQPDLISSDHVAVAKYSNYREWRETDFPDCYLK